MRIDDLRPSSNVRDRRGGGIAGFGMLGIIAIIVAMYLGVDPNQIFALIDQFAPQTQTHQAPLPDDPQFEFARRVMGSTEDVWTPILKAKGLTYEPATLVPYNDVTTTACGMGSSAVGPFYCPHDHSFYIDLSFFDELKRRFGAPGQFAQAYVIAHEVGHHVQDLLGVSDKMEEQMQGLTARGRNRLSVRVELQADCYAGVWANHADKQFHILEKGDVQDGLNAASAIGDDRIERQTQGQVVPDSFTHGTSAQRTRWFKKGLDAGDMDACDTFSASEL